MSAGVFVFPVAILVFFGTLVGYLVSNPAVPVPGSEQVGMRVEPGDTVTVELTVFYNATHPYAYQTTREDLFQQKTLDFGGLPPAVNATPQRIRLPADVVKRANDPYSQLLGHGVNETFNTTVIEGYYGQWTRSTQPSHLNTILRTLDRSGAQYTAFVNEFKNRTGKTPAADDTFSCGPPGVPITCRVLTVDDAAHTVRYRIEIGEGDTFAPEAFRWVASFPPAPKRPLVAHITDTTIEFQWDLRPGDRFWLVNALDWPNGVYRIVASTPAGYDVERYVPTLNGPPIQLVLEPVWFQFTIVDINRPVNAEST